MNHRSGVKESSSCFIVAAICRIGSKVITATARQKQRKLGRLSAADFDQLVPARIGDHARTFDCRVIAGWEQFADFPEASEHESCGLKYDYSFEPGWTSACVCQLETGLETSTVRMRNGQQWGVYDAVGQAVGGDKLGGWPRWVRSAKSMRPGNGS